jgi:hypothetical protein
MHCVASQAFVWQWHDHNNTMAHERALRWHTDALHEVTIHPILARPIRMRSKGIIETAIAAIVSVNRGEISIGMARLPGTMVVLS